MKSSGCFVTERSPNSLASRFQTISHSASIFVGCHAKVTSLEASGLSPSDIEQQALELFDATCRVGNFRFMQCWYIWRSSSKWGAWRTANEIKRTPQKRKASSTETSCSQVDEVGLELDHNQPTQPTDQHNESESKQTTGTQRANLDRANLALYSRQVKAAGMMALHAAARNRLTEGQIQLNLFNMRPTPGDELANEFLQLKRQLVLDRLRAEVVTMAPTPRTSPIRPAVTNSSVDDTDNSGSSATFTDPKPAL